MTLATPSALRILLIFGLLIVSDSEKPAFAQTSGSVVTINADKVLVINGRKTFPITLSPGPGDHSRTPAGIDALAELRDAGALIVRMAQTTDWNDQVIADQQAVLDWAAQHGMFCMVNLRERSEFASGDTATESALRSLVNQFKDHPALAIWKNQDEAWWGNVPVANLRRGYDVIKTEDPNHPIEQTHAPRGTLEDLQPYNDAADILAIDIYPVSIPPGTHSLLANKEISMIGDWTRFLGAVAAGQKQYWMVEQIAWSGVTPPRPLIFPTFAQSRFMAYQAIINGARGLMFFGGNVASALNEQDAPLGWNWTFWDDVLRRVVEEIGDHSILSNALVAPNSALSLGMSGATAAELEFVVREAGPYLYILACKREGTPKTVTFSGLPAWAITAEVLYESGRTLTASEGRFGDTFNPFDVHVYRFSQNSQGPTILHPPQPRDNHPGTPAVFRVVADGTAPLSYQWRKNGTELSDTETMSGTKSPTLILAKVAPSDAGSYDVLVRGTGNVISPGATLNVIEYGPNQLPVLAAQPQNQTRYIGETALLRVVVNGTGPFAYQWRKNGTELSNGGNVAGATSWRLRLSNVSALDTGDYDVVVSGAAQVTSAPAARLTVIPQPEQVLLYEPFDYSNVGEAVTNNTPGNWAFGGTGANDLNVVAENLSYDGLASPLGRSVANGGVGQGVRRLFGSAVADGQLFFSALFRINDLGSAWNGAPSQAGAFAATDNVSFRLAVMVRSAPAGTYLVGVQKGGSGATPTFASNPRAPGETLFLVGKYDFSVSPNTVSLWINPAAETFGGISEPQSGYIGAESGVDGFAIDRFNMRQNTAASVPAAMQWDELRVGTSWSDVTPPPLPLPAQLTRLDNGKFQFDYLNRSARGYTVYATSNFMDWTAIGSGSLIGPGLYRFVDQEASAHSRRFYQLRSP